MIKEISFLNNNKINNHVGIPNADFGILDAFSDTVFKHFIKTENGGFYFNKSLIIYGLSKSYSLVDMNIMLHDLYDNIIDGYQSFACDIFGNQFMLNKAGISLLNIESGDIEFIADNFSGWVNAIKIDTDFYTGESLLVKWEKGNRPLKYNELLAAKFPFVLGGEYSIDNLYALENEKLFEYNAFIAHQIYDLPDGTHINLKITD